MSRSDLQCIGPWGNLSQAIGCATLLLLTSPFHRGWYVHDLQRLILPAIDNGAVLFAVNEGGAHGFVTWALVSDEVLHGFLSGHHRLGPEDWSTGQNVLVVDMVAHHGAAKVLSRAVRNRFPNRTIYWRRRKTAGDRSVGVMNHARSLAVS